MKNSIFILFLCFIFHSVVSNAQYAEDAYRFASSSYSLGSTARMQAIGGAQIGLGGDISSVVSNPAGLGFFNKSVFVVTPSVNFSNADTRYSIVRTDTTIKSNDIDETFKNNFNFANIGTVIYFGKGRFTDDKFKGGSLAISLSRSNSFHLTRNYRGENGFNSIIDNILQEAGNKQVAELNTLGKAAFDQFLVSPAFDGNGNITGYNSSVKGFPIQKERIKQKGSHYQLNAGWGGNYDDMLYFGGGMGLHILNYSQKRVYDEFDFLFQDQDLDSLNALRVTDELSVRGIGVNFNAGAIVRPVEFMTIGASVTSPTFMSFDEESFSDLDADWDAGSQAVEEENGKTTTYDLANIDPYKSKLFVNSYQMKTPWRFGLGTAIFFGKKGFLSGDVEFVNYGKSKLNSEDFFTSKANGEIAANYESVMNIRLGGEYRIDNFRLRAGYSLFPDPIKNSDLGEKTNLTFGVGYRTVDYYLDFAVVSSSFKRQAIPYEVNPKAVQPAFVGQPTATSDINNTTVSVTFGLNF